MRKQNIDDPMREIAEAARLISQTRKEDLGELDQDLPDVQDFLYRHAERRQTLLQSSPMSQSVFQKSLLVEAPSVEGSTSRGTSPQLLTEDHHLAKEKISKLISRSSSRSIPYCKDCGRAFREVNKLSSILLADKTEDVPKQQRLILKGRYRCQLCSEITNDEEDMRKHMLNHISEGEVACEECLETAKIETKGHAVQPVECTHCYKTISNPSRVATKPSVSTIHESAENKRSSLNVGKSKRFLQNTIICEECEISMNQRSKSSAKKHETGNLKNFKIPLVYFSKPVQCRECDRVFSDVGQLIKEFITSDVRQSVTGTDVQTYYFCTVCSLKSIDNLHEHIANHAAYKEFLCSDCLGASMKSGESSSSSHSASTASTEKTPSSSSSIKQNNKCPECNNSLSISEELAQNLMRCELDPEKRSYYYHCNMCTEKRSSKCLLMRHLKTHAKEGAIKCIKCIRIQNSKR